MKKPVHDLRTLADCDVLLDWNGNRVADPRCPHCGEVFSPTMRVELYVSANIWVLPRCLHCDRTTPYRLERQVTA